MKIVDLKDRRFGRLLVVRSTGGSRGGSKLWECMCDCGNIIHATTRHLNREKCTVKSCGCLQKESGSNHKDWKGVGDISGAWFAMRVLRTSNKRLPIEINVTMEFIWDLFLKQDRRCALSGLPLTISTDSYEGDASLDRIDSSKGYIEGNVQWVHKHINFMKNKFDHNYFIEMCLVSEYTK